jgi:WD40 repeat protein
MSCSASPVRLVVPVVLALIAGCDGAPSTELDLAATSASTCSLTAGDQLAAACTDDSVPLVMSPRSAATPVAIQASVSYGLHLRKVSGHNEGAIRFVAAATGEHILYLGTPNVPLAITGPDGPVAMTCSSRLSAADCVHMRRGIGLDLAAGESYRIELGPIAPQRWVRLRVEPRQQAQQASLLVATAIDGPSTDLYAVDPETGATTLVVGSSGDETHPRWSPDRSQLAYVIDGQLRVATASGTGDHLVAPQVGRGPAGPQQSTVTAAAWSPDGTRLVYPFPRPPFIVMDGDETIDESYETTLHFVGADGSGDTPYAEPFDHGQPPGMGTLYDPAWSSQDLLAFANDDDCPDCAGGGEISSSLADGSSYRRMVVDNDFPFIHSVDFSPDGDEVVFERRSLSSADVGLTRATLDTSSDPSVITLVTQDLGVLGHAPVWSPDGQSIAFIRPDGVYIVDAEGATAPRLVLAATDIRGLDW